MLLLCLLPIRVLRSPCTQGGSTVRDTRFLARPIRQTLFLAPEGANLPVWCRTYSYKSLSKPKNNMGSETVLVPVRFLVTFTHLLACVMVSYTSDENVMRGLGLDHWFGTHSSSVEAKAEIDWLAASATALCIVDLVGLMSGFSMFKNSLSLLHICLHFFGSISVCWFILYSWHYKTFWYSFIGTNIIPSVAELLNALALFCCKTDGENRSILLNPKIKL